MALCAITFSAETDAKSKLEYDDDDMLSISLLATRADDRRTILVLFQWQGFRLMSQTLTSLERLGAMSE